MKSIALQGKPEKDTILKIGDHSVTLLADVEISVFIVYGNPPIPDLPGYASIGEPTSSGDCPHCNYPLYEGEHNFIDSSFIVGCKKCGLPILVQSSSLASPFGCFMTPLVVQHAQD